MSARASEGACEQLVHAIAGEKLSLSKLKLLHILARPHDRPPRISRVGTMLNLTAPQATRLVSELERLRLVDRVDDDDDARVKRVVITPKGRELVGRLDQVRVGSARRFLEELPLPERRHLDAALAPLVRRSDVAVYLPVEDAK